MQDVLVIGGSYAGMAATLQLARARRKVTVIDAGQRRNRFTTHAHGFLGQDGKDPAVIWAEARNQLLAYPSVTWIDGDAEMVAGGKDGFTITTKAGAVASGRRLLLATGLADQLPEVDGLAARWGKTVLHCPYCDGYELGGRAIGVLASHANALHQAELLTDWGTVTLLLNDAVAPDGAQRNALALRGVVVEETPVAAVQNKADVLLSDGRVLQSAGLFTTTRTSPASDLAARAGCALAETPSGTQIWTDDTKATSVPGIYAAGDVARGAHSVSLAVADGAWAGMQIHRSLVWPQG